MGMSLSPGVLPVRISGPFYEAVSVVSMEGEYGGGATHGIQGDGQGTASLGLGGLAGVIDNGLVILAESVD